MNKTPFALFFILCAFALTSCGSHPAAPPTAQDIEKALKDLNEKPAASGLDGAVTVEVKSVKIGDRRKWHFQDGGDATPDTDLWSARVHYLIRTHYRTRTLVFDWDKPVVVFRNGLGEWQVSITSGASKDATYDEPADMR